MMHRRSFPSRFALVLAVAVICIAVAGIWLLLLPAPALAGVLIGSESNGRLINSNVTPQGQRLELARMKRQGTQLVRANIGWNEVAAACGGVPVKLLSNHKHPCYNWTIIDGLVKGAARRHMKVLLSVSRVPTWASGSPDPMNMGDTDEQFNNVAVHYAAFHQAAARRYRPGSMHGVVRYWTVHNESNSATFWKPAPDAERYGILYAMTAQAIRRGSPSARIAAGPTNPTGSGDLSIAPLEFIKAAQESIDHHLPGDLDRRRSFIDAWAHNPYPVATGQPHVSLETAPEAFIGMGRVEQLIEQVDAHPLTEGKKLWATEFGWETSGRNSVSELRQAQFIAEAYDRLDNLGRFEIAGSYGLTDPTEASDLQTGTYRPNGRPKVAVRMMQRMISIPEGGITGEVAWGTTVKVWGRSNLSPRTGWILYSIGGRPWKKVPGQKRTHDGSIRASMLITSPKTYFVIKDNVSSNRDGFGLARVVRVRQVDSAPTPPVIVPPIVNAPVIDEPTPDPVSGCTPLCGPVTVELPVSEPAL